MKENLKQIASGMLFQLQAHILPKHIRKPQTKLVPVQFVWEWTRLDGIGRQTHETGRGVLPLETWASLDFFAEVFDDLEGGVVFHEEVQCGFVLVDEAADGGGDDLAQVGVHHELDGEVAYLFKD